MEIKETLKINDTQNLIKVLDNGSNKIIYIVNNIFDGARDASLSVAVTDICKDGASTDKVDEDPNTIDIKEKVAAYIDQISNEYSFTPEDIFVYMKLTFNIEKCDLLRDIIYSYLYSKTHRYNIKKNSNPDYNRFTKKDLGIILENKRLINMNGRINESIKASSLPNNNFINALKPTIRKYIENYPDDLPFRIKDIMHEMINDKKFIEKYYIKGSALFDIISDVIYSDMGGERSFEINHNEIPSNIEFLKRDNINNKENEICNIIREVIKDKKSRNLSIDTSNIRHQILRDRSFIYSYSNDINYLTTLIDKVKDELNQKS